MALLEITVPLDADWIATDQVRLRVGSEHAADLASSTPAGGSIEYSETLGDPDARGGGVELQKEIVPDDVCAVVPVGVDAADLIGNASAAVQTFQQLNDAPDGARSPLVASTGNAGEALFSFTPSPHVDAV